MAGAAVLDDIHALVEIGVHGHAELIRRHVHDFLAHALCEEVVPFLLEHRQVGFLGQRECDGKRPAPAEDVAGQQEPGADGLAPVDPVAHDDGRRQHAIAVHQRGHARLEHPLREFQRQLFVAIAVLRRGIAPRGLSIDGQVRVVVEEAGDQVASGSVDHDGAVRKAPGRAR